jgi:hypothetical protein
LLSLESETSVNEDKFLQLWNDLSPRVSTDEGIEMLTMDEDEKARMSMEFN